MSGCHWGRKVVVVVVVVVIRVVVVVGVVGVVVVGVHWSCVIVVREDCFRWLSL